MKQPAIGIPDSPWLTTDEAARYLRFSSLRAFYRWLEFHDLPCGRRGRIRLFERRVLDDFVRGAKWTTVHDRGETRRADSRRSRLRLTDTRRPADGSSKSGDAVGSVDGADGSGSDSGK